MPKGGGWDETSTSYRYRVRDPEDFQEGSFRTISLGDSGVKAVVGKLKGEDSMTIQALIFPKDKFTEEEARRWVKDHPDAVGKSAVSKKICFLKSDDEKRYTLGIVYEPDVVDSQGDYATAEDIEKAAWDFMRKSLRLGYMHKDSDNDIGDIVESYIAPVDMRIGDNVVKAGTWLIGVVWSPQYWEKVKSGEITGFSMGGTARRIREE